LGETWWSQVEFVGVVKEREGERDSSFAFPVDLSPLTRKVEFSGRVAATDWGAAIHPPTYPPSLPCSAAQRSAVTVQQGFISDSMPYMYVHVRSK
jgi:hypothetical protein